MEDSAGLRAEHAAQTFAWFSGSAVVPLHRPAVLSGFLAAVCGVLSMSACPFIEQALAASGADLEHRHIGRSHVSELSLAAVVAMPPASSRLTAPPVLSVSRSFLRFDGWRC